MSKITLYGIQNCGTIKKARAWLEDHGVDYHFHDYRKDGVDETRLRAWIKSQGWEALLNKRGMTWRKLDEEVKNNLDEQSAWDIMLEQPAIIKRPILVHGKQLTLGFDEAHYQSLFAG